MVTLVGAKIIWLEMTLERHKVHRLRFSDCGIRDGSDVLWVRYQGIGGPFPVEVQPHLPKQYGVEVLMTAIEFPNGPRREVTGPALVMIAYIDDSVEESPVVDALIDAMDCFLAGLYTRMIGAAQTAVEVRLAKVMSALFEKYVSKTKLANFFEADAPYSRQLNVLLPAICGMLRIDPMPREVASRLERARALRNAAMHRALRSEVSHKEAAEILVASLVATRYLGLLQDQLTGTAVI